MINLINDPVIACTLLCGHIKKSSNHKRHSELNGEGRKNRDNTKSANHIHFRIIMLYRHQVHIWDLSGIRKITWISTSSPIPIYQCQYDWFALRNATMHSDQPHYQSRGRVWSSEHASVFNKNTTGTQSQSYCSYAPWASLHLRSTRNRQFIQIKAPRCSSKYPYFEINIFKNQKKKGHPSLWRYTVGMPVLLPNKVHKKLHTKMISSI